MTGSTHILGGIIVGSAVILPLDLPPSVKFGTVTIAIIGALLPDIDNKGSTISRKLPFLALFIWLAQKIVYILTIPLKREKKRKIRAMCGHRGLTHSIAAAVLFAIITGAVAKILGSNNFILYGAGMFVGILSHLILDVFSNGAPILLPFSTKKVVKGTIKTGGFREWLIRLAMFPILAILIYQLFLDGWSPMYLM